MTSIHTYDPAGRHGAARAAAAAHRRLVVGAAELLQQAADLPQPRLHHRARQPRASTCSSLRTQASMRAITRWARRFGSVVTSQPATARTAPNLVPDRLQLLRHRRHGLRPHPGRTGQHLADQENPHVRP